MKRVIEYLRKNFESLIRSYKDCIIDQIAACAKDPKPTFLDCVRDKIIEKCIFSDYKDAGFLR